MRCLKISVTSKLTTQTAFFRGLELRDAKNLAGKILRMNQLPPARPVSMRQTTVLRFNEKMEDDELEPKPDVSRKVDFTKPPKPHTGQPWVTMNFKVNWH
jgi:hypothetical protein